MATAYHLKGAHQNAREALLANNWWAAAIRGVLAILIGVFAILAPAGTLLALVMIFAAYALVEGVFSIALAVRGARKHERWGWLALHGLISIAAAVVVMFFPLASIFTFAILFAAWAIVSGSASVAAGLGLGKSHGRWWLIAGGIIAILFGIWAAFDPGLGMIVLAYLVGFQALLAGATSLALAFQLRERKLEQPADNAASFDDEASREARHG